MPMRHGKARFASSAKSLTTRTHVNEVLDDAARIKRLRKELRELKGLRAQENAADPEEIAALTNKIKPETEVKDAVEKLGERTRENEPAKEIDKNEGNHDLHPPQRAFNSTSTRRTTARSRKSRKKPRETWAPGPGVHGPLEASTDGGDAVGAEAGLKEKNYEEASNVIG